MGSNKRYFAFISYQRQDEEWAIWLAHELEHYRLPVTLNGREDLPKDLRPIFRDIDELSAGNLPRQIHNALEKSQNLIVICSPRSANSKWVNKEIEDFIKMGKTEKIFPFIIEGCAFSGNLEDECFPSALLNLSKEEERLGGNINEKGRDAAVVKIVAGMLNLGFDDLWNRYEREKAEEETKMREQRNHLLTIQSRFLAKEAKELLLKHQYDTASLIALEALPNNLDCPDRPYVREAEEVLREASIETTPIIRYTEPTYFCYECNLAVTTEKGYFIRIWDTQTFREIKRLHLFKLAPQGLDSYQIRNGLFDKIFFVASKCSQKIIIACKNYLYLLDYVAEKSYLLLKVDNDYSFRDVVISPNNEYLCCISFLNIISPLDERQYVERDLVSILDLDTLSILERKYFPNTVSVSISPDSRLVAYACGHEIHLYNVGTRLYTYKLKSYINYGECCFSDCRTLLFSRKDFSLRKWNFEDDQYEAGLLSTISSDITGIICKDYLVAISTASNEIIVIDTNLKVNIGALHWHSSIRLHSFSKDGKKISYLDDDSFRTWNYFNYDIDQYLLYYHPDIILCVGYSVDRAYIISASYNCIKIWDTRQQIVVHTINVGSYIDQIAMSSDKKNIFFVDEKGSWCLNIVSENLKQISSETLKMQLSPDEETLLLANENSISLYDAMTMQKNLKIVLPEEQLLMLGYDCIAFSPDGDLFATLICLDDPSEMIVAIWNSKTGNCIDRLTYDSGYGKSITFTPDSDCVIIDNYFKWNFRENNYEEIDLVPQKEEFVIDGTMLIIKRDLPLQVVIDETRSRLKHCQLSLDDRKKYYID